MTTGQNRTEGPCEARSATEAPSGVRGELVSVFVHGVPAPKGSLERSRYGRAYWPKHVTDWCDTVALACQAAYRTMRGPTAAPHSGPVAVELAFSFERPASHGVGQRRGVRVGQKRPVSVHVFASELEEGRRAVGAELKASYYEQARRNLLSVETGKGRTLDMFQARP